MIVSSKVPKQTVSEFECEQLYPGMSHLTDMHSTSSSSIKTLKQYRTAFCPILLGNVNLIYTETLGRNFDSFFPSIHQTLLWSQQEL
jgi:hypothetical protein